MNMVMHMFIRHISFWSCLVVLLLLLLLLVLPFPCCNLSS
jgi:hypothetical protein